TAASCGACLHLLQARGLVVWLVNARDARAPAGPPQDRQAGCGVAGQAQREGDSGAPLFPTRRAPPAAGRATARGRHVQRLEKLLEDAMIKLGTVATDIMGSLRAGHAGGADRRAA